MIAPAPGLEGPGPRGHRERLRFQRAGARAGTIPPCRSAKPPAPNTGTFTDTHEADTTPAAARAGGARVPACAGCRLRRRQHERRLRGFLAWAVSKGRLCSQSYTCDIGDAGVVGHNCKGAQSLQALQNTLISSASLCWGEFVDSSGPPSPCVAGSSYSALQLRTWIHCYSSTGQPLARG